METTAVYDCNIIRLQQIKNRSGNITALTSNQELPFNIKRIFYLYDIPAGESRGAHAHKSCHQFLIAASGSFEVLLNDGRTERIIQLNRPFYGLHIPPGIWASEINFSSGSICLVMTSHGYDANDYIRDYNEFIRFCKFRILETTELVNVVNT
jgi:oxalate decarboxylase/phosphoglucose isomerase-like protein (cupin superfamily)